MVHGAEHRLPHSMVDISANSSFLQGCRLYIDLLGTARELPPSRGGFPSASLVRSWSPRGAQSWCDWIAANDPGLLKVTNGASINE